MNSEPLMIVQDRSDLQLIIFLRNYLAEGLEAAEWHPCKDRRKMRKQNSSQPAMFNSSVSIPSWGKPGNSPQISRDLLRLWRVCRKGHHTLLAQAPFRKIQVAIRNHYCERPQHKVPSPMGLLHPTCWAVVLPFCTTEQDSIPQVARVCSFNNLE